MNKYLTAVLFGIIGLGSSLVYAHGNHHHGHHDEAPSSVTENKETIALKQINGNYLKSVKPIFEKKCFDCHSSQTQYPWYHSIPLVKQYLDSDVKEGRTHIDVTKDFPFQGHGSPEDDLEAIAESVEKSTMPPLTYRIMHPGSKVTDAEREIVLSWTKESLSLLKPHNESEEKGHTHE